MTTTYSVTRDQVIKAALRTIGVLGLTQVPSANDYTYASEALNIMLKYWESKGATLWKIQEVVVPMVANQNSYLLGPGGIGPNRPLRVLDQGNFIRNNTTPSNPLDTPITLLGRNEYKMYGSKNSLGVPNSIYYDPQLTNGVLYLYPTPADTTRSVYLQCQMPYSDITNGTDVPDFPQEWFEALKYGLARELLVEYGVDQATEARIERRFADAFPSLLDFSQDEASAYWTYDSRSR